MISPRNLLSVCQSSVQALSFLSYIDSIFNTPAAGQSVEGVSNLSQEQWLKIVKAVQDFATSRGSRIPILFGLDSVHGANYVREAVLFPHQISGAASFNRDLVKKMVNYIYRFLENICFFSLFFEPLGFPSSRLLIL